MLLCDLAIHSASISNRLWEAIAVLELYAIYPRAATSVRLKSVFKRVWPGFPTAKIIQQRDAVLGSFGRKTLLVEACRAVVPPPKITGPTSPRHKFLAVNQTQLALGMSPTTNSFGHDRLNPVFLAVDEVRKGGRPPVLTRLAHRLPQLYGMLTRAQWKALSCAKVSRKRRERRQRQIYSQRREAVVRLLQAMVTSLDLRSMAVVCPDGRTGNLEPVTLAWLAERAGLGLKRADRAMADIQAMGLVFVKQRRERTEEGGWRSKAAIRRVSKLLFSVLGLGDELDKSRKNKSRLQRLKREKRDMVDDRTKTEQARGALMTRNILSGVLGESSRRFDRKPKSGHSHNPDPDETESRRRGALKKIQLLEAMKASLST